MKGRSDPTTPLSVKLEAPHASKIDLFEDEDDPAEESSHLEIEEFDEEPSPKRVRRIYPAAKAVKYTPAAPPQKTQTIEYIISQQDYDTSDNFIATSSASNDQIQIQEVEVQPEPKIEQFKGADRYKKRSKGLGKYVAALMYDIKNDKTFFETQAQILQVIEQAILKSKNPHS